MAKTKKWVIERRAVKSLSPSPENCIFSEESSWPIKELAADMDKNGLEHPIDILPNGRIVAGHQRWSAAKLLRWKHIRCRVRYDLAAAGDDAAEEYLLRDNTLRRQLGPMEIARVYRRLKELQRNNGRPRQKGDVRDFIAQRFGKSGRTLDRWARLLEAPTAVQDAVAAGKLKLLDGCRVVDLPSDVQSKIAKRISKGEDAKNAVQCFVDEKKSEPAGVGTLLRRFIRDLERHTDQLGGRIEVLESFAWARHLAHLREAQEMIGRLCDRIEEIANDSQCSELIDKYCEQREQE